VLKIPEEHREGLATIARLSDADANILISALDDTPAIRPMRKIAERIEPLLSLPKADVHNIIDTLVALYTVRSSNEIPAATFTQDVCKAMRVKDGCSPPIGDPECETLQRRLSVLMAVDSLRVASKAIELQFEHERVFDRARILTDVRTVFGEAPDDIQGAVISHQLRISYVQGSEIKEIYLALDEEDLGDLKKGIERALGKMRTLEGLLERAGVKDLDSHRA
jgi:hypothetical protein